MKWLELSTANALALGLVLVSASVVGADEIRTERIQFKKGTSAATVSGHLKGNDTIDYVLGAKSGQQMSVTLQTKSTAAYFNLLPPGSNDEAIFIGSTSGNEYSGRLPADGDYKVRVYLMRSAARRNERADFTLKVSINGSAQAAAAKLPAQNDPVARAGAGRFDAKGQLPCAQAVGQPMAQCDFGVARGANGAATVVVSFPGGSKRTLFFEGGKFSGADVSQADGSLETQVTRESDLNLIRVGPERYEIVDAVIVGG